jgi:hypothetical protein
MPVVSSHSEGFLVYAEITGTIHIYIYNRNNIKEVLDGYSLYDVSTNA